MKLSWIYQVDGEIRKIFSYTWFCSFSIILYFDSPLVWRNNGRDGVLGLFTQPFIEAQINENIKAPRHWPIAENSHRWIPGTNGQ